jgi:hypothetical protein
MSLWQRRQLHLHGDFGLFAGPDEHGVGDGITDGSRLEVRVLLAALYLAGVDDVEVLAHPALCVAGDQAFGLTRDDGAVGQGLL